MNIVFIIISDGMSKNQHKNNTYINIKWRH